MVKLYLRLIRLVSMAALAASVLCCTTAASGQKVAETPKIAVVGHGSVTVPPDLAVLTAAVETTSESARAASATNAEKTSEVVEAVKEILREDDSIRTTNFSLQPRYAPRRPGAQAPPEITGYVARNEVRVEMRDLELVGRIIDAAIEAGANRASSLRFLREDRTPLHEALAKAGTEARAQAESIAAALRSVQENYDRFQKEIEELREERDKNWKATRKDLERRIAEAQ